MSSKMLARIPQSEVNQLRRLYKKWHWGAMPKKAVEWRDPAMPRTMVEIGRLAELYFQAGPKAKHEAIMVREDLINSGHVAFDPRHKHQRIYILTPQEMRNAVRRMFWEPYAPSGRMTLAECAAHTTGCHATRDYPPVQVQPIGWLTHVTYLTEKKGDGVSYYIHEFGEEKGHGVGDHQPILAADALGRLWVAGGDYTCPVPGITN